MSAIIKNTKILELRTLCVSEFETQEFVQVEYLCPLDSHLSNNELLDKCGGIRAIGMSTDKELMRLGIYPISILYEKCGQVIRARENSMFEFDCIEKNIYMPNKEGINILCRIKHLKKQQAA